MFSDGLTRGRVSLRYEGWVPTDQLVTTSKTYISTLACFDQSPHYFAQSNVILTARRQSVSITKPLGDIIHFLHLPHLLLELIAPLLPLGALRDRYPGELVDDENSSPLKD